MEKVKAEAATAAQAEVEATDARATTTAQLSSSSPVHSSAGTISQQRLERASQRMGGANILTMLRRTSHDISAGEESVGVEGAYSMAPPSKRKEGGESRTTAGSSSSNAAAATATASTSTSWISRPVEEEGKGKSLYNRLREAAEAGVWPKVD